MNKNGQLDFGILILFLMIIFGVFYIGSFSSEEEIGKVQNDILVSYITVENYRDYIELSAEYATKLAAEDSGATDGSDCFSGLSGFKSSFKNHFEDFLNNVEDMPSYTYNIDIQDSKINIKGTSSDNFKINKDSEIPDVNYIYEAEADFDVTVDCEYY